MRCLLDMDGVLVNFVKGACRAHRRMNPYADSANHGIWDMAQIWGISPAEFLEPFTEEWWENLEPTAEMGHIVKRLEAKFGQKNICILSSPSGNEYSMPAKLRWIRKHLPAYKRQYLFGPCKEFCGDTPRHVLIDDYDKNVINFDQSMGRAILLPRLWNRRHYDAQHPLKILDRDLAMIQ